MNKKECVKELEAAGFKFDGDWSEFYREVDIGSGQVMEERVYADGWDGIDADADVADLPVWHVAANAGSAFETLWSRRTLHDVKSILSDCLGRYMWPERAAERDAEPEDAPSELECGFLELQDWMRQDDRPYYWLKDLNGVYGHIATMNLEFRDGGWHVTVCCIERGDILCMSRSTLKGMLDGLCDMLKDPASDLVKYLTEKKEIRSAPDGQDKG